MIGAIAAFGEPSGQGWQQVGELAIAFGLSSIIGLEREVRQKSAGLRTHTIVGLGAALFMLLSKYGFTDVLQSGRVVLDPSRVAAQIVSGIGFIGGGLIFVRRDAVRGLTTAATVWLTAAVGAAAGAGLPVLAVLATAAYGVVAVGYPPLVSRLPRSLSAPSRLLLGYEDGRGVLRRILAAITDMGFVVAEVRLDRGSPERERDTGLVRVELQITGAAHMADLTAVLGDIDGVVEVEAGDVNDSAQ